MPWALPSSRLCPGRLERTAETTTCSQLRMHHALHAGEDWSLSTRSRAIASTITRHEERLHVYVGPHDEIGTLLTPHIFQRSKSSFTKTRFLNTLCTTQHIVNQYLGDVKFDPTNMLKIYQSWEIPPSTRNSYFGKAWNRIEVDCWHHWESPWAPQPSRERFHVFCERKANLCKNKIR